MTVLRPTNRMLRRAIGVVALTAATLSVSGCDPKQAGSAAVVGGYRVTESMVQEQATAVQDGLAQLGGKAPNGGLLLQTTVTRLVSQHLVGLAAARENIVVTQGQVDALIQTSGGRKALEDKFLQTEGSWSPPNTLNESAKAFLIEQALAQKLAPGDTTNQAAVVTQYLGDLAKSVGVEISPRYGVWDPTKIALGPAKDDLSKPAVAPAPSPAA